jgi:hypothetical protein
MNKRKKLATLAVAALCVLAATAQSVKINGIGHNNRYDDGDQMKTTYVGWNAELGKAIFIVDQGLYTMTWNGTSLTTPEKEPPVVASEIKGNNEKEIWANNFNLMTGNSGACYVNGKLVTVMSRDEQSTTDDELFAVRKWDAKTGNLLSSQTFPKSARLESAGMSYNPVDGKVYGLFYLTGNDLPEEITNDPDYFEDQDADMTDGDAGYAICTIDLATMKITPITPGLYYYNFITFAINSEGRAFALTSGGTSNAGMTNGKVTDIDGNLAGAQLCEFDLTTGLMKTNPVQATDPETGETYPDYVNIYTHGTGYCSQYKRQAACFAKSNPNKMYWVGFVNSGKGFNDWGSWSSLSDKEWRTNGKYDTALYEVDITTGEATQLTKVKNRWSFSALWIDGDDASDDATVDPFQPGDTQPTDGAYIALQHADNGSIWQKVEIGKQYTYYLEPAEGWMLHSVTFNGQELTVEDNTVTTPAVSAEHSTLIVTFEQTGTTAIAEHQPSTVKILGSANGIHVTNAQKGDTVDVYTTDGRLVRSQRLSGTQADISLNAGALYIIKVGTKTVKVRL